MEKITDDINLIIAYILMTIPFLQRVSGKEKEFFSQQMSLMLEAGIALPKAVDIIYRQSRNKYFQKILSGVAKSLQNGRQLSQALSHYPRVFGLEYLAVLKSGESTGRLGKVFAELAKQLKEENAYRAGVLSALIYPLVIILAIISVGIYLVFEVIPEIAQLFAQQDVSMPFSTRSLIAIVNFLNSYWYVVILAIVALVILVRMYARTKSGMLWASQLQLKIPVIRELFEAEYVSRFCRTLAMLTRYGVPIIEAVDIARGTMKNVLYKSAAGEMISSLERGLPLSKPIMEDPIFPPLVGQMILVGEQTGKLDDALDSIADHYKAESTVMLKNLSSLVEPILIIIVGLGVAYVVFAILMPVYQISQIS